MYYLIDHIAVVKRGRWFSFRRNEVQKVISIPAARSWMLGRTAFEPIEAGAGASDAAQRNMLALADVEYVITVEVRLSAQAQPPADNIWKYVEQVRSRAAKGKCAHRPALGCREFAADFDVVEDLATVQADPTLTEQLGVMLYDVFDPAERATQRHVRQRPVFFRAHVEAGRMNCHPDRIKDDLIRPASRRN
jgi:CRISPR-associated protein Cas5d